MGSWFISPSQDQILDRHRFTREQVEVTSQRQPVEVVAENTNHHHHQVSVSTQVDFIDLLDDSDDVIEVINPKLDTLNQTSNNNNSNNNNKGSRSGNGAAGSSHLPMAMEEEVVSLEKLPIRAQGREEDDSDKSTSKRVTKEKNVCTLGGEIGVNETENLQIEKAGTTTGEGKGGSWDKLLKSIKEKLMGDDDVCVNCKATVAGTEMEGETQKMRESSRVRLVQEFLKKRLLEETAHGGERVVMNSNKTSA